MATDDVTAPVKEGEVLAAKYRVERVIGAGAMGVVVSATHLELDRRVALKFLLPQALNSDELVARFVREAKASVKLKGDHVAKTLDVGRMDDGRAYIVMEYLEGRDLDAELRASGEPLPIADAVGWIVQACEGIAEAHALGIVHRDLKPGNLFLTRTADGQPLVKVLDFGISKSFDPTASDAISLTKTEMLLGSPLYMAPEQLRSAKHVDERADIWALGAIAYQLLTRRVPFEADTLLDLCFKVAAGTCAPVHELRPEIGAELGAVIMRCLEKEPEARWKDVGALAAALEPFARPEERGTAARAAALLAAGVTPSARQSNPDLREPGAAPAAASPTKSSPSDRPRATTAATSPMASSKSELKVKDAEIEKKDNLGRIAAIGLIAAIGIGAVLVARAGSPTSTTPPSSEEEAPPPTAVTPPSSPAADPGAAGTASTVASSAAPDPTSVAAPGASASAATAATSPGAMPPPPLVMTDFVGKANPALVAPRGSGSYLLQRPPAPSGSPSPQP